MGERFKIYESTSVFDQLTSGWIEVTIKDTETGNEAKGTGRTKEEAEQNAWEQLKRIQGPTPSERRR
jgi:hypothetical protein